MHSSSCCSCCYASRRLMDFYLDCVRPWYEMRRVGKIIGLEERGRQKQSKNGTRRRVNLKNVKSVAVSSAIY